MLAVTFVSIVMPSRHHVLGVPILGAILAVSAAVAQVRSVLTASDNFASTRPVMVYDDSRERLLVALGRGVILEWDGASWAIGPAQLSGQVVSAAYDPARRRSFVLVAGSSSGRLLSYDGGGVMDHGVAPLVAGNLVVDTARQRLVAVGHLTGSSQPSFFEWNGIAWTQISAASQPIAGTVECAAFDESRAVTVVTFNRITSAGWFHDTWEWNGIAWTQVASEVGPPQFGPFAYDPHLLGMVTAQGAARVWNGTAWSPLSAATPADQVLALATDHVHGVVWRLGSAASGQVLARFDGTSWNSVATMMQPGFAIMVGHPVFHEGFGRLLHYESIRRTAATWDGLHWSELTMTTVPTSRYGHSMVYDSARGEVVLHGGSDAATGQPLGDTWAWNGAWRHVTGIGPQLRTFACIADDRGRGRVVLIGSDSLTVAPTERWEWDGSSWSRVGTPAPANVFSLFRPALGYDEARQLLVLHSEVGTWEQIAGQWQSVASGAPGAEQPNLVWNAGRQRLQMRTFAGTIDEWDGTSWQTVGADRGEIAYDRARGLLLSNSSTELAQWSDAPASVFDFGRGCGSAPTPTLLPFGMPRLGNADFHVDLRAQGGQQFAALSIGLLAGNVPLGGGCTLYVQQEFAFQVALTNASGFLHQPVPIPDVPALLGLGVVLQGGVFDAGAPLGVALTSGLRLVLGR